MKKLLTLAVAALMTVSLAGCGSSKAENKLVVGQDKMNGEFIEGFGNNSYDKSIRDLIHGYNPVIVDNDGNIKWETKVTLKGEPAVKNNKVFSVNLNEVYCSGVRTYDGIMTFAKSIIPDLITNKMKRKPDLKMEFFMESRSMCWR